MRSTCLTLAAGAAALLLLAACDRRPSSQAAAAPVRERPARVGPAITPEIEFLERHALAAFVAPIIDEHLPPAFTSAAVARVCEAGTRVSIDNRPLQDGRPVPPRVWTATWNMVGCRPFGAAGPRLDGELDVVAYRRADGWGGVVVPRAVVVTTADGRHPWTHAFGARPLAQPPLP